MKSAVASPVETVLSDELARADRALGGVAPVLGHLLAGSGGSLVSDMIVARVRGMLTDLANQFVVRQSEHIGNSADCVAYDDVDTLAQQLMADPAILVHVHTAAVEGVIAEALDQRRAIDPVLSPLWQELIASNDAALGETAMKALTAQSRFMQAQRRMQQPVLDLPAGALEIAVRIWARSAPREHESAVTEAIGSLKSQYDEAETRLGLIASLTASMRSGVVAALELEHAGLALFVSALSARTGQSRESAVLACHERQAARLAVGLRAAGQDIEAIERQFLCLEPAFKLPRGIENLSVDAATAMLQDSASRMAFVGRP